MKCFVIFNQGNGYLNHQWDYMDSIYQAMLFETEQEAIYFLADPNDKVVRVTVTIETEE